MRSNSSIKARDLGLAGRIEHLVLEYKPTDPLDGSCFHLNFSDVTYDQEEFAKILWSTLPLFALTSDEYEKFQLESVSEMQPEAYRRITKNDSASDYGELLLFLILDYFFDVPKFVTKVRARTSEGVAVFGADCAHVSFNDDGSPIIWLGEAKFKEKFSGALDDALDSVEKLIKVANLKSELRLLDPHIEANQGFSPDFMAKVSDITRGVVPIGSFDIRIPVLLITDSPAARDAKSLDELKAKLEAECVRRLKSIKKKNWPIMNRVKFDFILFPLSNKAALVEKLKTYIA